MRETDYGLRQGLQNKCSQSEAGEEWSITDNKAIEKSRGCVVTESQPITATWECKMDHISYILNNLEI